YMGRGIITTTNSETFLQTLHSILSLRSLKCFLPIEIYYNGPSSLTTTEIKILKRIHDVSVIDIWKRVSYNVEIMTDLSLRDKLSKDVIVLYASVLSQFREVIILGDSSNALMFIDPEDVLESSSIYKKYGTLFYRDRTLGDGIGIANWVQDITGSGGAGVSKYVLENSRLMKGLSQFEMDGGVVILDKGRIDILLGLLAACKLNEKFVREEVTGKYLYGTQETIWIGMELVRSPWSFSVRTGGPYPGLLGFTDSSGNICGHLLHLSEDLKPFYWTGGVTQSRENSAHGNSIMKFEWRSYENVGDTSKIGWMLGSSPSCLKYDAAVVGRVRLGEGEKKVLDMYIKIYDELMKEGAEAYVLKRF
ncbi:hypothetical protein HDU76_012677, partial [Blyttiomyces sp. JEL0837]